MMVVFQLLVAIEEQPQGNRRGKVEYFGKNLVATENRDRHIRLPPLSGMLCGMEPMDDGPM